MHVTVSLFFAHFTFCWRSVHANSLGCHETNDQLDVGFALSNVAWFANNSRDGLRGWTSNKKIKGWINKLTFSKKRTCFPSKGANFHPQVKVQHLQKNESSKLFLSSADSRIEINNSANKFPVQFLGNFTRIQGRKKYWEGERERERQRERQRERKREKVVDREGRQEKLRDKTLHPKANSC